MAGTVSLLLAWFGWRNREQPIVRPFTLLMAAETVWIFGYALELMTTSLPTVLILNDIEYPALQTVPIAWLFIILLYTGRGRYLTWRTVPLFFIVPAVVFLLVLTNPYHHLYYTGFSLARVGDSLVWIYGHGPLFWIHIGYCYLLGLVALVIAAGRLFSTTALYRRQTIILVCAACIPAFCNMAYVFQLSPFPEYDLTPVAFLLAGIILAIGLLRYQLFSAVPVAYSLVFSTMRDGVIATNGEYRVIDLNPAAGRISGINTDDAIGRPVAGIIPALSEVTKDNEPGPGERHAEISLPGEGTERFYDVLITPMGAVGTDAAGYLFLFRDISERKLAELALAQANKKIGLLTSITRHDLQNKLMGVASYHELIQELATDPAQIEYLDNQAKALAAMREQIAFTREYEQLGTETPVWQDLGATIRRARDHVDLRTIATTITCDTGYAEIYADPMLWKVFYNLLDNAAKYGGEGISAINVSARREDGDLVISFLDNGSGIPREDKPRLFSRGFGRNTGLGLFLSREILAITGITITETGEPGRGALFEIRVPPGKFRFPVTGQ
jgi:PAS domain S-box-containing protein